jgi:hypothetical protein
MDLPLRADGWVPVDSCTLPTHEQPPRAAEFDDLFANAVRAVEHPYAGSDIVNGKNFATGVLFAPSTTSDR